MVDRLGRTIDYMRISVTDRCNFRCRYCMPPGGAPCVRTGDAPLEYGEILQIVRAALELGICHFRVTGGEPFVRPGLTGFLREIKELPGVETLSVTTNGSLLEGRLEELREIGIYSLNISLDTLDPDRFEWLTGKRELEQVLAAIRQAAEMGFPHLKINCVPLEGWNEDELCGLAALAREYPLDVRFIELMPLGAGTGWRRVPQSRVEERLEEQYGPLLAEKEETQEGRGPAVYCRPAGFQGKIGFISAISHEFCESCSRIRLLSDGTLKPCLNGPGRVKLGEMIRRGAGTEELKEAMRAVIFEKPGRHGFEEIKGIAAGEEWACGGEEGCFMSSIGG